MDEARPERRIVTIRDLDAAVWALVRSEAQRRRWSTAAVLEHIVREWAACKRPEAVAS